MCMQFMRAKWDFYNALLAKLICTFERFIKAGTAEKSWHAIILLLTWLQMACDHIALTVKSHINEEEWYAAVAGMQLRQEITMTTTTM